MVLLRVEEIFCARQEYFLGVELLEFRLGAGIKAEFWACLAW
jgi:hypothetical protein